MTTVYDTLRALPGSLKLAIALAGPLIAVALFDAIGRRTRNAAPRPSPTDTSYDLLNDEQSFDAFKEVLASQSSDAGISSPPTR